MFLFKLWIFNINFETILSFIFGIFFGIILICLIYAIVVVGSIGDKKFLVKTEKDTLTEAEAKDRVENAIVQFKDKKLRGKTGKFAHCYKISKELALGIASEFYPKSKYPLFEITIDEAVMLLGYIDKRIDEIINGNKLLKTLKRFKVSQIVDLSHKTSAVTNSTAFKVSKDVNKVVKVGKRILDIINPINIVKRATMDVTVNIITNKLCVIIIKVVGEEVFKIYSKKVLNKDAEIDTNIEETLNDLENDIKDLNTKEKNNNETNIEMKYLSRYYEINKNKEIKYKSIYDPEMKMKTGDE